MGDAMWKSLTDGRRAEPARVPEGMRLYVVGDIHGRADLLQSLQTQIEADVARHPDRDQRLIYLGDYVDRGPPFLSSRKAHPLMVVHGHHVTAAVDVRANRIGVDTGAYATGRLSCLVLEGTRRWLLDTRQGGPRLLPD